MKKYIMKAEGFVVKAIAFVLVFSFVMSPCSYVMAASKNEDSIDVLSLMDDSEFVAEQSARIEGEYNINPAVDEEKAVFFHEMVRQGYIYVNAEGLIQVVDASDLGASRSGEVHRKMLLEIKNDFTLINFLVAAGLYEIDSDFTVIVNAEKFIANATPGNMEILKELVRERTGRSGFNETNRSDNILRAAHSCNLLEVDFGTMAEDNLNFLYDFYLQILSDAAQYGMTIDPYPSTVAVWITYVKNGGSWDYKTVSPYNTGATLCITYAGGSDIHIDRGGEFMGNYNYGYTGSFLFSLPVLIAGSIFVALSNEVWDLSHEFEDHVVIEEGFNDAQ